MPELLTLYDAKTEVRNETRVHSDFNLDLGVGKAAKRVRRAYRPVCEPLLPRLSPPGYAHALASAAPKSTR